MKQSYSKRRCQKEKYIIQNHKDYAIEIINDKSKTYQRIKPKNILL